MIKIVQGFKKDNKSIEKEEVMGVPKKKRTRTRRNRRRAMQKLVPPTLTECSHCHKMIAPHRVCPYCGYYDRELIVTPKEKKKKEEA